MPLPLLAGLAIAQGVIGGASALQKMLASINQGKEARELSKTKRPILSVPNEYNQALAETRMAYNNPINTGNEIANQRIENTTTNALANASKIGMSGGDQLAALGGAMAQENVAKGDLTQQMIDRKYNLMNSYLSELNNVGDFRLKQFEYNQAEPYENIRQAVKALKQTSKANAQGAFQDIASTIGGIGNMALQGKAVGMDMGMGKLGGLLGKIGNVTLTPEQQAQSQAAEGFMQNKYGEGKTKLPLNPVATVTPNGSLISNIPQIGDAKPNIESSLGSLESEQNKDLGDKGIGGLMNPKFNALDGSETDYDANWLRKTMSNLRKQKIMQEKNYLLNNPIKRLAYQNTNLY